MITQSSRIRFALVFLLCLASGGVGRADVSSPALGPAAGELREAVRAALPPEALVLFVQGDEVYLDVTRARGAAVGQTWTIERPGSEILHPVTGAVVGRSRRRTGEVKITWFQDDFSKAAIVAQSAEEGGIRVKDTARPAAPSIVVPFQLRHENGTLSRLTRLLDAEIASALAGLEAAEIRTGPAIASTAASAPSVTSLVAEAAVSVTGRVLDEAVEIHVVRGSTGEVLRSFTVAIPESLRPLGAEKITTAPGGAAAGALERIGYREGGEISAVLKFIPVDMTVGDVNGDGVDEIIFAEEKHVRICRLKLDGTLEELHRQSLGFTAQIMKVHAVDIDGDGKAELFVTENPGNSIRSSGWRFNNNRLERFHRESDMFLRTVRVGPETLLLGQRHGSSRPFERGIVRYRAAGRRLSASSAGYPGMLTLYDFAPVGTTGFIASIDYENRLRLLDHSGAATWTGAEYYGGSDVKIQSRDKRNEMEERGGVATIDLDGDGVEEILVVQNLLEGGVGQGFVRIGALQQYKSGRLVALALEKNELVERWKTKNYNGIIKGYSIGSPLSRGPEAVFFTVEKISLFEHRAILRTVPLN